MSVHLREGARLAQFIALPVVRVDVDRLVVEERFV